MTEHLNPPPAEVVFEDACAGLTLSDRNRITNWPWEEMGDSPEERRLKALWRSIRGLPEVPF